MFAAVLLVVIVTLARHVARAARGLDRSGESATLADPAELGAAWGWSLLFLMLLGPVLLPWYVTWGLPLVWLLPRVPRWALLGVSTALAVSQFTAEPGRYPHAYNANILIGHYVIAPLVAVALVWLLLDGVRRFSGGTPLRASDGGQDVADPTAHC